MMDKSFISPCHISEYWSGTVVQCLTRNMIAWCDLHETEMCHDDEGETDYTMIQGHMQYPDGTHRDVDWEISEYEDIFQYIQPWFPSSFFYTSEEGDGIFVMNKLDHYKRSATGEVYTACVYNMINGKLQLRGCDSRFSGVSTWGVVDRTLEEAIRAAAECRSTTIALSQDFGIVLSTDDWYGALMFRDMPIGMVDNGFGITLHPKYVQHFGPVVQRLMNGGTAHV